ncbi:glycoside hydrolase family protein [Streptomyces tubercidicus]|uniref:hypothetical protein n=1 Tax=Streptomyces tubercidicus TaxID=47759 RepID=UPI00368952F4
MVLITQHRISSPMKSFDPEDGVVVLTPERQEPGYWVGCAGVLYEADRGRFLLTYRERRPRGHAESERGWRCAVAVSTDGVSFEDVWSVHKDELGTSSMERFSILPKPGGGYELYITSVDPADNRWRIDVVEADTPDAFDVSARRPVLTAASTGTEGVKDPYVFRIGPLTYLYASYAEKGDWSSEQASLAHSNADIYTTGVTTHPTGLAIRVDGGDYTWHGEALDTGDGWDRYQARLNCVVPTGAGYLGFYDGSSSHEENYEERCGLAVSHDLRQWTRLTTDQPWVTAESKTGSVRYADALRIGDEWWVYYEITRDDAAHELRLVRQPVA